MFIPNQISTGTRYAPTVAAALTALSMPLATFALLPLTPFSMLLAAATSALFGTVACHLWRSSALSILSIAATRGARTR